MNKNYKYFNREISWLDFNNRVLEEACDKTNPLLERLKFISIYFNNLDEFIMVRISAIITQIKSGKSVHDPSGDTPQEIMSKLQKKIKDSISVAHNCIQNDILVNLEKEGIVFYNSQNIPQEYNEQLLAMFLKKYFLILTPMAIDKSRPFPFLSGKILNVLFCLENPKKTDEHLYAVIPLPDNEAFIPLAGNNGRNEYIYTSELVKLFAGHFFKGYTILKSCVFRITRDAELNIDEEGAEDLLSVISEELKKRDKGISVRLEVESSIDDELFDFLNGYIEYYDGFCFKKAGFLDPSSFFSLSSIKGYDHLKNKELISSSQFLFNPAENIFKTISKKDIILNLPYESFDPVIRLVEEAANDEKVLAIKQTLYRTSYYSPIIEALKKAAENGKQVTVLVELKARFDEEQNIGWAKQLEEKGCHVIYGLVGLKTHCKMLLIVRDEPDGIKRYVHLSTGNYNEKTAKIYTDIGLFTSRNSFGRDISSVFNVLTGYSELPRWKKIVTAPTDLRNFFIEKIDVEIDNVRNGGKGRIYAKMNSLVDTAIIEKLYDASKAGVEIKLLVRGMCCLIPGIKNQSENISVISIVDRFLEHSRIYYFYNAGNDNIFFSSADWMERNFDRRIEILYPIEDEDNKKEILSILKIYFNDNIKTRVLNSNGTYEKVKLKKGAKKIQSQIEIYKYFLEKDKKKIKNKQVFIPKMNPLDKEKIK